MASQLHIAVIGGGPAGLRAAEVAAESGMEVTIFDAKPSAGRKLLIAGRGGLNLTHSKARERITACYKGPDMPTDLWPSLLEEFGPDALRAWATGLGVETFEASTGRVYPRELKAAPLLRAWIKRLHALGVRFAMNHRWTSIAPQTPLRLDFLANQDPRSFSADAVVLALGGRSWPQTGSDGRWTAILEQHGIALTSFQAANCGWEVKWPPGILATVEGKPLKNIAASAGDSTVTGELLITAYGLEGGAIYQLGPNLRAMAKPEITIDFKPASTQAQLVARMGCIRKKKCNFLAEAAQRWRLSPAACALVGLHGPFESANALATVVKSCAVRLEGPRPIAEAISSAGGVSWNELDTGLMLKKLPGVFVAGEMIDWEAPTGGYLLQGCFSTGTRAARGAVEFARHTAKRNAS